MKTIKATEEIFLKVWKISVIEKSKKSLCKPQMAFLKGKIR